VHFLEGPASPLSRAVRLAEGPLAYSVSEREADGQVLLLPDKRVRDAMTVAFTAGQFATRGQHRLARLPEMQPLDRQDNGEAAMTAFAKSWRRE
jgi:hypothetical protein